MKNSSRMDVIFDVDGRSISIEDIQTDNREAVAKMFLDCRKELGLTQGQVALVAGMDRANIARLENAKYNPSLEMLTRYAAALGKKLVISLEDDDAKNNRVLKAYEALLTK